MQGYEKLALTLYKIANAVNTTENLNDLFASIHDSLNAIIDASNFYIALYDRQQDLISFPYCVDLADGFLEDINSASSSGSLTSKVIQTGRPHFFKKEDVLAQIHHSNLDAVGTPAELWLGVPLKTKGDIIGAIVVQSYNDPDIYHQKDMDLLIAVSDQVALAIDRKKSHEELKQSEKLTHSLLTISNAVNTTHDLKALYKSIHQALKEVMDVTNFAIGIYDKDRDLMSYPYYIDETGDVYHEIKDVRKSSILAGAVITQKAPIFITKEGIKKRAGKKDKKLAARNPEQWLGVPLKIKDEVIGVIFVQSYEDPERYQQKDADILLSISDQIAMAIDRKKAQESALKNEALTRALFKISNAVNTTENLDELYQAIHRTLNQLKPLPNFIISIVHENRGTVSFPLFIDESDKVPLQREIPYDENSPSMTLDVIKQKKPLFLNQAELNERHRTKRMLGHAPAVWMGVPLIIRGKVIGVMVVQHYTDSSYFIPEDMDLFVSVSDQVALAIDRKRSQNIILQHQQELEEKVRKRTEELRKSCAAFEMSEKRFREMTELLPQTVFELDMDGRFTYTNRHGLKITGYSMDEFEQGIHFSELVDPEDRDRIREGMALPLSEKKVGQAEFMLRKKDGSLAPVLLYSNMILSGSRSVGWRGVLVDMTERKKTEALMIQTEKMMSVAGMAAGMAHEINNPLSGIIQSSQVIKNRLTKPMPANKKVLDEMGVSMDVITGFIKKRGLLSHLDNISQAGQRAAKIIENMLGFARKSNSVKQSYSLDEILDTSIELARNDYDLKKKYDFKNIEIIREYTPDMPWVSCEKSKIQQVIFNILKNASQAMFSMENMPEKLKIILSLSMEKNMARIQIRDNGPGMDEKIRKKVFEPFFTTKGLGKGTGLGLSVSYFIIVDDHGGTMEVASTPGKGTSFIIRLPLESES
ncbi:MAG: GAF domain-containing protein [Desulfobacter sp.]|nr:MAG: GAF domain-containing protein [Desulfobacter sp.]